MWQFATITSKKQLTLPAKIVKKYNFRVGQRVAFGEERGRLFLVPAEEVVEELAGSLKIPEKWKGKSLDQIVDISRQEYFQAKAK